MKRELQIVSFDIPFPANYGGAIDVYYKIKQLATCENFEITLHCFQYGDREPQKELERYCKEVYYYPRCTGIRGISLTLPYIVSSRKNEVLLKRLINNKAPILFEGIHCCLYLNHPLLKKHLKLVRVHNIETEYYYRLYKNSTGLKQIYYLEESRRLKRFEPILKSAQYILPISDHDFVHYQKVFQQTKVKKIAAFHSFEDVQIKEGKGEYALFFGSLNVGENNKSALFLVHEVFADLKFKLKITGRNPTTALKNAIATYENIELIADPEQDELHSLIENAQVLCMHASQASGVKLKLVHALFRGRHIIANDLMITETYLGKVVTLANDSSEWKKAVLHLKKEIVTKEIIKNRSLALTPLHIKNEAAKLAAVIPLVS